MVSILRSFLGRFSKKKSESSFELLAKIFSESDVALLESRLYDNEIILKLERVESILQYKFNNRALLFAALIHHSYAHDIGINIDYERFEFLGDTVLESVISTYIFNKFFQYKEGELSELRAYIVSGSSLLYLAEELKLPENIFLGKAEVGEKNIKNIIADVFEAIIGAVYLDSSFKVVEEIILKIFKLYIDSSVENNSFHDPKTRLQQLCQKLYKRLPSYKVVRVEGPDHDKTFFIELTIIALDDAGSKKEIFSVEKSGKSKRVAEKLAAVEALKKLTP